MRCILLLSDFADIMSKISYNSVTTVMGLLFYPDGKDVTKLEAATKYLLSKYSSGLDDADILAACNTALEEALATYDKDKSAFETYYRNLAEWQIIKVFKLEATEKRSGQNVSLDNLQNKIADDRDKTDKALKDILDNSPLSDIEYKILYECYYEERFLADIARELNITREYARRIHNRALDKLKKVIEK